MSAHTHGIENPDILSLLAIKAPERARLMRTGEEIPGPLEAGFDVLNQIDSKWVWVLTSGEEITGVLVASPCHGTAMIWRISISKSASSTALVRLLRVFLKDCRNRGIRGYLTILGQGTEAQSRLGRIIERAGGKIIESGMIMWALPQAKDGI